MTLFIDYETRSQCDLKKHGLARYAQDPTTEIICMGWAVDDNEPQMWWHCDELPQELEDAILSDCAVYAHNADFEQSITNNVAVWNILATRWRCSMVQALAHGLPAALGECAEAMGLEVQKQKEGSRLIREYCAPGFLTEFKDGDKELMEDYCLYDVKVMQAIVSGLRPLSDYEWSEYHLNSKINHLGLPIDVEFVNEALKYADDIAADVNGKISKLTDGAMTKHTQRKARDAFLFPKLTADQMKLLTVHKDGKEKISLDQEHRGYLLACNDLDEQARELVELIDAAGSAALKKYGAAANTHVNGRVHNTFLFHGAQTGRFSGRGIQPHNFRRDAFGAEEAESLIADIKEGYEIDNPTETMARLLRPMIYSKKGISYVDWSAIEGRVAPWLANSDQGEEKLDLYRAKKDVYIETASGMFGQDASDLVQRVAQGDGEAKGYRQAGKICELSLQYAGGKGALQGMAKNYGVIFDDEEAENLVYLWRNANSWAEAIWSKFENACFNAVQNVGKPYSAGVCTFQSDGTFLWCKLPSGRFLAYYRPKLEVFDTPWGDENYGATFQTSTKVKIADREKLGKLYHRNYMRGGLMFQNAVQAIAADILREATVKADKAGLTVIGHVHDEIILEGGFNDGEQLNTIMLKNPTWAKGIPLATGGVEYGNRYGK